MTSAPVTNQGSFFMDVTKTDALRSDGKQGTDFTQAMNTAQSKTRESSEQSVRTREEKPVRAEKEDSASQTDDRKIKTEEKSEDVKPEDAKAEGRIEETQDAEELPEEQLIVDAVSEAIATMVNAIAEELGIEPQEVIASLEELGIDTQDLLNPAELPNIMVKLTGGEDMMSLVTDADLYQSVQELAETAVQTTKQIAEELQIPEKQVIDILTQNDVTSEGLVRKQPEPAQEISNMQSQPEQEMNAPVEEEGSNLVNNFSQATRVNTQSEDQASQHPEHGSEQQHQNAEAAALANLMNEIQSLGETAQASAADFGETVDTEMIMRQITDYIRVQNNTNVSEIEMQLHPESLGTVNLQLTASKEGVITANFFTENEAVKAALETQITSLRENLEQQGFKVDAVEVAVGNYQQNAEAQTGEERGQQQETSEDVRRAARLRRINLGELTEEDTEITQEEEITVDMMRRMGNSVDYLA